MEILGITLDQEKVDEARARFEQNHALVCKKGKLNFSELLACFAGADSLKDIASAHGVSRQMVGLTFGICCPRGKVCVTAGGFTASRK
jgi:hypothetical protein